MHALRTKSRSWPIPQESKQSLNKVISQVSTLSSLSRFPLYTRSILPSPQTKYAIYLLRQNVSQLCYDITGHCDIRNTFGNLLELFETLRHIERTQRDEPDSSKSQSLSATGRHANGLTVSPVNPQLSQSHSSVDMNHVPLPTTANAAKEALLQQLLPPGVTQALAIEGYASTQRYGIYNWKYIMWTYSIYIYLP